MLIVDERWMVRVQLKLEAWDIVDWDGQLKIQSLRSKFRCFGAMSTRRTYSR